MIIYKLFIIYFPAFIIGDNHLSVRMVELPIVDIPLTDANYHHFRKSRPFIKQFCQTCSGTVLDLGCGNKPFQDWFPPEVNYIGLDVTRDNKEVDFLASALDVPIKNESVDHLFSTQVIEHLPDPFKFFEEVERILKPGGSVFVATPQMWPLHEVPNDYFRFTKYGLCHLAESTGLNVTDTIETGNLMMRLCSKLGYLIKSLPIRQTKIPITILNLLFFPLTKFSYRGDYIFTAIVAKKAID